MLIAIGIAGAIGGIITYNERQKNERAWSIIPTHLIDLQLRMGPSGYGPWNLSGTIFNRAPTRVAAIKLLIFVYDCSPEAAREIIG